MTIRIDISPELESQLTAKAAAAGKDVAAFVLDVVKSSVGNGVSHIPSETAEASRIAWARFLSTARAATRNLPAGHSLDDSRDRTYEGLGE